MFTIKINKSDFKANYVIILYMNDVLIKNEHQNNENNNKYNNNNNNNFTNNICLDISSCEFCGDLLCYNKSSSTVVVGGCCDGGNSGNSIENDSKIYKKSSLIKYLIGGISEESEVLYNNDDNDCLICYDIKDCKPIVVCSLCSKFCHYKCYKKFTKKNNFYAMKCIQCGTRSLQFKKSWWQFWCCF